jgi:GNAT superfamily N-acetyltransferase
MPSWIVSEQIVPQPVIRRASVHDVPRAVELIAGGSLEGRRWDDPREPLDRGYYDAFAAITADPDCELMVAEFDGFVVGTFQFSVLKNFHHSGQPIAQVESVHVAEAMRGKKIGEAMMRWAIDEARCRGCFRIQLTSNAARTDAHRFYDRLGFEKSHVGFKMTFDE